MIDIKSKINKIKPYLPSEKFTTNFGIYAGILVCILGSSQLPKHFENIREKQHIKKELSGLTVGDITRRDSDGDGVLDWEEYLWGTDPKKIDTDSDGITDTQFIAQKRSELQEKTGVTNLDDNTSTNELAKEYFTAIIALQQSGGLTTEAMTNLASNLAENISLTQLPDTFTESSLSIVAPTNISRTNYKNEISAKLSENGNGNMGTEFTYIDALTRDEYSRGTARTSLEGIANTYKTFAVSISQISVPSDIVEAHVTFVNALYNTGLSLETTSAFWDDPIAGIEGLLQYRFYSTTVEDSLNSFQTYFTNNAIL